MDFCDVNLVVGPEQRQSIASAMAL